MNWQNIKVSFDNTHFLFEGKQLFGKYYIQVLKYHEPGLAPVKDKSGSYHIDSFGKEFYTCRYTKTFGFYCNRAAVVENLNWFHITEKGERAYPNSFSWTGNYQEDLCTVRDSYNNYFHIDLNGNRIYIDNYLYCGDFKDGIACVKTGEEFYRHIDTKGNFINDKAYLDLGVFHKNYAIARDKNGWYHIDKSGKEIYAQRFLQVEPFYNGFALATQFNYRKLIIDEDGQSVITL